MKWIGQNIYDFISRFRNDVFLEDVKSGTIASASNLGLDSNNKIVKATITSHDEVTLAGTPDYITISGQEITRNAVDLTADVTGTLPVANGGTGLTSLSTLLNSNVDHDTLTNFAANEHFTQANITTVGTIDTGEWRGTAINATYLDGQSGTNTGDETLSSINGLSITTVGTIDTGVWNGTAIASANLDADTAHLTTAQTFTGVKTFGTTTKLQFRDANAYINSPDANDLEIAATDIVLDAAGTVTVEADDLVVNSANANDPLINIINDANDATSGRLRFLNRRGADGQDDDETGIIEFFSFDDGTPAGERYSRIIGTIHDATSGQESGRLTFQVASHDGGDEDGLVLTGGSADAEVDVTIGNGAASVTTIAGSLRPTGQIHIQQTAFNRDIATSEFFIPFNTTAESANITNVNVPMVMPVAGKLLKIHMRVNQNHNTSSNTVTFKLYDVDDGEIWNSGNSNVLGTKVIDGTGKEVIMVADFQDLTTAGASGTNAFQANDTIGVTITNSQDLAATNYVITMVFELDFSSY